MLQPWHPHGPFTHQLGTEKELEILEAFCKLPNVVGWCPNVWYDRLIRKYPFEYLRFTQHKPINSPRRSIELDNLKQNLFQQIESVLSRQIDAEDISTLQSLHQLLQTILHK